MGRLLWIVLALALAAAAGYALVRRPPPVAAPPAPSAEPPGAPPARAEPDAKAAPHGDIDDASRAELERILREADERDDAAKRR